MCAVCLSVAMGFGGLMLDACCGTPCLPPSTSCLPPSWSSCVDRSVCCGQELCVLSNGVLHVQYGQGKGAGGCCSSVCATLSIQTRGSTLLPVCIRHGLVCHI